MRVLLDAAKQLTKAPSMMDDATACCLFAAMAVRVPGAPHAGSYAADPQAYGKGVASFFDASLR
jgi:hypothetical protein